MTEPRRSVREATLLCWNVAGRVRRLTEQAALVVEMGADIVCLQETTLGTSVAWADLLAQQGWFHIAVATPKPAIAARRTRPLLAVTAARTSLDVIDVPAVPWPERVIGARTGGLEVINVHSPTSTKPHLAKVLTHESVHAHLSTGSGPRLVCGDLNTPRKELPDGRVWTFARDRYGRLRPDRGERWDRAELALIKDLEPSGFRDAFRHLHGLEVREVSWEWQRWGGGYRLDHLVVSAEITVSEVSYLHRWREQGLSDHSAMFARLSWPAADLDAHSS
ncbi:MAG: endonuclease/exonuclease/phosphatase family protein [Solirubrobacterales bacterium]|nr:endonuclease/exonuclease/phosphatase family protein [Solirubrobacterales bacterium]